MQDSKTTPVIANPWQQLRRFTSARIALGRAGVSQPTQPHLAFQVAHAQARVAVHLPFDGEMLERTLRERGQEVIRLHSAVPDRFTYLQRPDWGRRLDEDSRSHLEARAAKLEDHIDVVFVIADGLSALGIHEHAVAFLDAVLAKLKPEEWRLAPVVVVEQGRVAIGDEIGEVLKAQMVVVVIGERPGLSSPDSVGVYFTYGPRVGRNDAERNCISNIRPAGLSFDRAAHKLCYLMSEARSRKLSGVKLKDQAESSEQPLEGPTAERNFLSTDQVDS
ncbi:MAG: ethanolamine ammonia-lyase subunit EutC [Gammaproteobacteria bacterium]|nr:ethanolamine ammonia-lyase subunit EutC [Gammaproteobacteria bacterium]